MNLTERAMLVSLNVRKWQATRNDRKVSAEVAAAHGVAEKRAGKYRKNAIDTDALSYKAVITAGSNMRNRHYELTLPWGQDGARILPAALFDKYTDEMRALSRTFDKAVSAFVTDYPLLKAAAKREMNGLYNEADYPTNIAAHFDTKYTVMPMPDAEDFRVSLGAEAVDEIKAGVKAEVERTISEAARDPYQRLYEVISKMVERLSKKDNVFRDTLVTNVADLCSILPGLNLLNDPKLDELCKRAEKLVSNVDPEDLRQVPAVRRKVAKDAKAIQDVMAAFMGAPAEAVEDAA